MARRTIAAKQRGALPDYQRNTCQTIRHRPSVILGNSGPAHRHQKPRHGEEEQSPNYSLKRAPHDEPTRFILQSLRPSRYGPLKSHSLTSPPGKMRSFRARAGRLLDHRRRRLVVCGLLLLATQENSCAAPSDTSIPLYKSCLNGDSRGHARSSP